MLHQLDRWAHRRPAGYTWLLPFLWMGLVFIVSSRSTLPSLTSGTADAVLKKSAHAVEYAILMVLWWKPLSGQMGRGRALLAAWAAAVLYAVSDEYHQTFVPGREGRVADVLVDATGALLAGLGIWWRTRSAGLVRGKT